MLTEEIKSGIIKQDITVVVPTWNEAEAIGQVIDELREYGYENILVVDGYSSDGTGEIAARKSVRVVNQTGSGKTGALSTAAQYVKTPYMLVMDGDYTYDPSCIATLTAHAETYDEVIGARTVGRENIPLFNRLGNRLLSYFFRLMFAVNLKDVCSGMYLLRTEAARKLEFTTGGFDVEVEIAAQFANGEKVTEVPVNYRKRLGRQKLSSVKHGLTIALSTLRLAHSHNAVLLYGAFVALSGIPGLAIVAWVMYERLYLGVWHGGYALFGMMLLVLSMQSIMVVTISILIKRSEQRIYHTLKTTLTSKP
jgi:glycosyltransferase involved in cell wall biosynthesis